MPKEVLSEIEYEALANLRREPQVPQGQRQGRRSSRSFTVGTLGAACYQGARNRRRDQRFQSGRELFLAPAAAAELAEALQERGYLTIGIKQQRRPVVLLTDQAEGLLRQLTPAHLYEIRGIAPELMQALRPAGSQADEDGGIDAVTLPMAEGSWPGSRKTI